MCSSMEENRSHCWYPFMSANNMGKVITVDDTQLDIVVVHDSAGPH